MKALKISVYVYNILFAVCILATHFLCLLGRYGNASDPFIQSISVVLFYQILLELFLLGPIIFAAASLISVILIIGSDFLGAMKTRDMVINLTIFGVAALSFILRLLLVYGGTWFS